MKNILIVSPHPDDETLGCSGVLFNHYANNDNIFLFTSTISNDKFPSLIFTIPPEECAANDKSIFNGISQSIFPKV